MRKVFLFFLLLSEALLAEKVDFLSAYDMALFCPLKKMAQETGFKVRYLKWNFHLYYQLYYLKHANEVDKIVLFSAEVPSYDELKLVPKNKIISFEWEASFIKTRNKAPHACRVYTLDDDVVDNVVYFKYYYPVWLPMVSQITSFEKKKFCVMVSRAETKERSKIIRFFETKPNNEFDLFGYQPVVPSSRYRGPVPGHEFDMQKAELMKNYRFAICFENKAVTGYISEKIFACLAAGCIPIYFGAPNITKFIPKNCFIDYRDFQTDEELYRFLKNMSKETYEEYIENIKRFVSSPQAKLFSAENFSKTIREAVKNLPPSNGPLLLRGEG